MADNDDTKKRLGDFEIIRELGRGGMGVVYEARQVSLNRKVALKVISGSLGLSSKAVLRFQREAEAAGKLHHTNIVPIYSTGQDDGTHYYAMELIDGPSLQQVISSMREERKGDAAVESAADSVGMEIDSISDLLRELPPWVAQSMGGGADAGSDSSTTLRSSDSSSSLQSGTHYFDTVARMIAEVADALDHAHENGVIHRDIKPANLLLAPDGHLSVTDFGLARMLEQPGMTMSGEFVGSPLYMSPEQITAGRVPLDHRTDIFSLGATLYELLTLAPPFPGRGRDEVMAQILHKEPRRPRNVNKKVPVDLETICLKALEKDPDQRYQTAGQLAEDLRRFVNRFEITAKRAGPIARAVKWARRRPAVAGLSVGMLVVAVLAGILAYSLHQSEEAARVSRGQKELDQAIVEIFSGRFEKADGHLRNAERLKLDPGRVRVLRGLVALEKGDGKKAIEELKLAVGQLPDSLGAHALLLNAYSQAGHQAEVARIWAKVLEMEPVLPEDYLFGALSIGGWREEQSIEWLRKIASERHSPIAEMYLGYRLIQDISKTYKDEGLEEALLRISTAKSMMPYNLGAARRYVWAHLIAADICKLKNDGFHYKEYLRKAEEEAARLLENHKTTGPTYTANFHLAVYQGRLEDAETFVKEGVKYPRFNPPLKLFVPLLYLQGRPLEESLELLNKFPEGLKADPSWVRDHAFVVAEHQNPEAAKKAYQDWLSKKYPPNPARRHRSVPYQIFQFLGRSKDARKFSKEFLTQLGPPPGQKSIFYNALDQFVCGKASAQSLLASAQNRRQRHHAYYLVGLERLSEGFRKEAMTYFEKVEREGSFLFFGQPWAVALLKRLRDDPEWPLWIPVKDPADASRK